jgi:N-acetylglutamate synthase-like GNAT family acetyltransferase
MSGRIEIRRKLREGDLEEIVAFHGRIYGREYGVDDRFEEMVAGAVGDAVRRGFPGEHERVWIVERDGEFAGCLALTDAGDDSGAVRWFVFAPSVRGRGLGRRLMDELVAEAQELGFERLKLETFSDLTVAAGMYRSYGFEIVDEDTRPRWGRDSITYQYYELDLARLKRGARGLHSVAGSA